MLNTFCSNITFFVSARRQRPFGPADHSAGSFSIQGKEGGGKRRFSERRRGVGEINEALK